ncbi:MAG: LPS export ABC transporter periplasmic protein LptC [Candidatus Omnitrophica bacterium]|nr:LPS export ABC transporter periplasmic protein LptC [Candidatus Omnitrophota bacterium]
MNLTLWVGWASLCVAFLGGCQKVPPQAKTSVSGVQEAAERDVISTFTLVGHSENGRRKWKVEGETADLMAETVELSPVRATTFGQIEMNLTAKKGWFHKPTRDIRLREDVVVTTSDGAWLTANSFNWKAQEETGTTDDWVTMTRPGMKVVGQAGVVYPKLKRLRLLKQVTVTLLGEKGKTLVTCEGPMEVDYHHHKARFWRNVIVEDSKGTIRSDRMDVALEPNTHQLTRASFYGHVQIHQENRVATSHRANYWQPLGKTMLTGHPRLLMASSREEEKE